MNDPYYDILLDTKPLVVLLDVGPWDRHLTITNGAEAVVKQLFEGGVIGDETALLYYDSLGDLDEIVHQGGRLLGFRPARHLAEVVAQDPAVREALLRASDPPLVVDGGP